MYYECVTNNNVFVLLRSLSGCCMLPIYTLLLCSLSTTIYTMDTQRTGLGIPRSKTSPDHPVKPIATQTPPRPLTPSIPRRSTTPSYWSQDNLPIVRGNEAKRLLYGQAVTHFCILTVLKQCTCVGDIMDIKKIIAAYVSEGNHSDMNCKQKRCRERLNLEQLPDSEGMSSCIPMTIPLKEIHQACKSLIISPKILCIVTAQEDTSTATLQRISESPLIRLNESQLQSLTLHSTSRNVILILSPSILERYEAYEKLKAQKFYYFSYPGGSPIGYSQCIPPSRERMVYQAFKGIYPYVTTDLF